MTRDPAVLLRAAVAGAVVALSPGLPAYEAAAQEVSALAAASGGAGISGVAGAAAAAVGGAPSRILPGLPSLSLAPTPLTAEALAPIRTPTAAPAFPSASVEPLGSRPARALSTAGLAAAPSVSRPSPSSFGDEASAPRPFSAAAAPAFAMRLAGGPAFPAIHATRAPRTQLAPAPAEAADVSNAAGLAPRPRAEGVPGGVAPGFQFEAVVDEANLFLSGAARVDESAPEAAPDPDALAESVRSVPTPDLLKPKRRAAAPAAPAADARRAPGTAMDASSSPAAAPSRPDVRARAPRRGLARVAGAIAVAALVFLNPAIALAAGPWSSASGAAAAASSVSILSTIHPLASVIAAAAGAVYGLLAARKDGPAPSAGAVLASVLRYGILSGTGMYVLVDLARLVFLGSAGVGIATLPAAVATAALGQSAFQGKFADPATSSADRIMGAFPAVAAALGLSVNVGFGLLAGGGLYAAAMGVMAVTAVAAALYAAMFKPGRSPAEGPAAMARGYVLQTLMLGLALALTHPALVASFAVLAAWGFWDVLATVVRAAAAYRPGSARGAQAKRS